MENGKKFALTNEGIEKLEEELKDLKGPRRKEIAQKLKEARAQGDLSENAEYDAAKDEQSKMEARIAQIEHILRNAEVISEANGDCIALGSKVKLFDIEFDEEVEYHIVGPAEANPREGRISDESPLGKGLIGQKAGANVDITGPTGDVMKFKVLNIS
ncbi:MAG: transcription elongation factor GreA [Defluviitaleaceae bacterium]|nr:transcription elongation factor GreA [Defluviitaleaceae bacterium]